MLDDLKFIDQKDPKDELGTIERAWRDKSALLKEAAKQWRADKPTNDNLAKQIAEFLAGKSVVVYTSDKDLAKTWKDNIARRANNRVFSVVLRADDQTELAAWRSHPVDKPYGIILLRDHHPSEANEVIDLMKQKLSGLWPHPLEIVPPESGNDWLIFLSEISAVYLAILNGVSPSKL